MEIMFNELSIFPLCIDKYTAAEKMKTFVTTFAEAKKNGFRRIRSDKYSYEIELSKGYTIKDWLHDNSVPKRLRENLISVFVHPFINEEDETVEADFITNDFYFENKKYDIQYQKCYGLAAAYLYQTLSLSLASNNLWKKERLYIIIASEEEKKSEIVYNIAEYSSFSDTDLAAYVEKIGDIELLESSLTEDEKEIKISEHHGKAELTEFAEKLKKSPFVEIIRSTDWGGKNFIRKVYKDGVIEIVLVNTKRQYALWIQTTGRNIREAKEIAEIIEQKYY